MPKSKKNLKSKVNKRCRKNKTSKGGKCPCSGMSGGFGAASYQGGLDQNILPLNNNIGTNVDPITPSGGQLTSERFAPFTGGKRRNKSGSKKSKKSNKSKKMKGGFSFLLGNSAVTNPLIGFGTAAGASSAANTFMGAGQQVNPNPHVHPNIHKA